MCGPDRSTPHGRQRVLQCERHVVLPDEGDGRRADPAQDLDRTRTCCKNRRTITAANARTTGASSDARARTNRARRAEQRAQAMASG